MKPRMKPPGRRIREAREAAKLTQKELGQLLDVDHSIVGRIERDEIGVTATRLMRIARLLRVSAAWLLGEKDEPTEAAS